MSVESEYINKVVTTVNMLAKYTTDISNELHKEYFDKSYNTSINDAAVGAVFEGMTAADFTGAITLLDQLNNFTGNSAVTQADYAASINKVRVHGLV